MNEELAVHIAAFAAAIEDEVTAEKASERTHRHALVEGTLVSDTGDENFLYFFSTPKSMDASYREPTWVGTVIWCRLLPASSWGPRCARPP
jgi:uncharacterized protein (DUF1786 family)